MKQLLLVQKLSAKKYNVCIILFRDVGARDTLKSVCGDYVFGPLLNFFWQKLRKS
jgi:hypothetical protein